MGAAMNVDECVGCWCGGHFMFVINNHEINHVDNGSFSSTRCFARFSIQRRLKFSFVFCKFHI